MRSARIRRSAVLARTVAERLSGPVQVGGWPLDPFGEKQNGHGIEVSEKVTDWQALGSTTPGVFVGIGDSLNGKKAATVLADVQHPVVTASTPTGTAGHEQAVELRQQRRITPTRFSPRKAIWSTSR